MVVVELPVRKREYPNYPAEVICGALRFDGLVRNLTAGGAMFESTHEFRIGAQVTLDIAGRGTIPSTVAWSFGGRTGMKFDEPQG